VRTLGEEGRLRLARVLPVVRARVRVKVRVRFRVKVRVQG
jgi:hypothetical protein